jgi:hypothetical protein
MSKKVKQINPELKKGDRIILVHMQDESVGIGTKGKVLGKENTPKFSKDDLGYQYRMEWYDDNGNVISKLSLLPEVDGWIYDKSFDRDNIQEINIKNIDDLIEVGTFYSLFKKTELKKIFEYFELERLLGLYNPITEGGKFLLTGTEYFKDYIKLKSYDTEFDEEKEELIEKLSKRLSNLRDIFIRASIKLLESENKDTEIDKIKRTMVRLAQTAKKYWFTYEHKNYINKKIE